MEVLEGDLARSCEEQVRKMKKREIKSGGANPLAAFFCVIMVTKVIHTNLKITINSIYNICTLLLMVKQDSVLCLFYSAAA